MSTLTAARVLDALEPISLDELVADASLQTRVDRKYLVPRHVVADVLRHLPGRTRVLDIDGRRTFGYRSVYLDTPELRSFHDAGRDRRRRFKIRGRVYLDTGTSWLEVKTRAGRSTTVKARVPHPDLDTSPLTPEGADFLRGQLAVVGVTDLDTARLRPTLGTAYDRTTLLLPATSGGSASRATVDLDLTWSGRADLDGARLRRPDLAVVETKGGATPGAVDRTLWSLGHRPASISKYGTGLTALRPDLPDLKWHRALNHHLGAQPRPRDPRRSTS